MLLIAAESALQTRLADGASVIIADVPSRAQVEQAEGHFHDSHTYGRRFMLRIDEPSQTKLQQLVEQFGVSKAEIIRQLIAQANDQDFPKSWQMRAAEHSAQQTPQKGTGKERSRQYDQESTL